MKKIKCYEVDVNYIKFIFQANEADKVLPFTRDTALRMDGDDHVRITVVTEDEQEESV